ncbi:restriction endonuclease subunit S [Vibrio cholerae]|uniref:restriction endonuclease subunit S n=1 Tax=Vibrio cholerae TaxID=666 RepID=UPI000E69520F|nr:restriction endonuclease subunit S [Vibrio cholerae]USN27438.1 restriction endonuclease subunit S [synthetic construct]EGR1061762.1 restriction endonuclease subunit S [Vibrio cholerae]EGR4368287.1 restriction endonuclease subunit S [Vibrio cholerae]EJL6374913.1 restriction endonuclease subunit S [Vibrio cholerae]ELJ8682828.1 restriction endonuclease subunit S [Vibrio cholerae]
MSWPLVKLGDVAKLINGDRGKNYPSKGSFVDKGIPFINAGCLSNEHTLIDAELNFITEEKFDSLRSGKIEKGDILFCLRGSLGKFALVDTNIKGAIASSLVIIRANEKVCIDYLKHYLGSFLCQREIQAYENGAAQPNLSATDLKSFQIPLPPLEVQKRIAAILDKADAIRQKRKQAIDLADEFLRSVFLDMFGDPVTNPKGWEVTTCGETFKLSSGKGLTAKNMDKDGNYLVYGGNGINGKHSEYMFEEPQLIIGRVGVYCGSIHITEKKSWVTDNAMYIKEYLKKVNIIFLAQLLDLANLNQYAGKAAQPLISGNRIYPLEIIFPPIEEQERFAKIHKVFIESITKLHGGLESKSDLFQSLSQKAFSGQL